MPSVVGVDFDIAVIGGGPAGSRTAKLLAESGRSVVLFEAGGPEHEVLCSGLLNREARFALGTDLPASVRREPFSPKLEFRDMDNLIRKRYDPGYWNMDRPAFDRWLRDEAAVAGAEVRTKTRVRRLTPNESGVELDIGGERVQTRLAVDATGWRSVSRKLFKLTPPPQMHAFQGVCSIDVAEDSMWAVYLSKVTPYYGWIVPKGGRTFLLGAGFPRGAEATRDQHDDPWSKLQPFIRQVESAGHAVSLIDPKPQGHPITCISSMSQLWWGKSGIFPVGEAAGMVSPSSGDGISYCLQGAAAFSAALAGIDLDRIRYEQNGLSSSDHNAFVRAMRRNMRSALAELRFNIAKAWVAARPALRGISSVFLPLYLRRNVESLRF